MDRAYGAMMGGGGISLVAANSDKVDQAFNSQAMQSAVNWLHAPLVEIGGSYIALNTIFSFTGCILGLYGLYKTIKDKK